MLSNSDSEVWRKTGEVQDPRSLQSVMVCDAMPSAGVGSGWSTLFYQVRNQRSRLPEDFRGLHAFISYYALWRFPFQQDLASVYVLQL